MRDEKEFLEDILEAIEAIEKYSCKGKAAFEKEELIQNWILRHLQIIGEAACKVSSETQQKYKAVPWKKMIGMRNILVHGYFSIDTEVVWAVVETHLSSLKTGVTEMLAQFS